MIAHIKASVMPWLNRLLRRSSRTYRIMQHEQIASLERRGAQTGNVWSDLMRGVGVRTDE